MDNMAGQKTSLSIVTNLSVIALVLIWLIPTIGLLVSSFRDREQISETGWWASMFPVAQAYRVSPEPVDVTREGDLYMFSGNLFEASDEVSAQGSGDVSGFGIAGRDPASPFQLSR